MRKKSFKKAVAGFCSAVMLASSLSMGIVTDSLALSSGTDANGVWISNNQNNNTYYWGSSQNANFASVMNSYLVSIADGSFMRVEYGSDGNLHIEYYDKDFNQMSRKSIKGELSLFGGFYFDGSNYYVVYGQENKEEDNTKEVIRIVKYDTAWKKTGTYSLCGANTTVPFDAGSLRIDSDEQYLYVLTSHEMYKYYDGINHQANVYLKVKKSDMTGVIERYSIAYNEVGYVSHSFNQFIKVRGDYVYTLNHGDAYPRSAVLMRNSKASVYTDIIDLITYYGIEGANATYAQIGGMELSSSHILTVGKSTKQNGTDTIQNAYITTTSLNDFSDKGTTFTWLTNEDSSTTYTVKNPQLVKISDSRFLLLINEQSSSDSELIYSLLDASGKKIGDTVTLHSSQTGIKYSLSDCQPVYDAKNNRVVWYVTNQDTVRFCSINLSNLQYSETSVGRAIHIDDIIITADSLTIKEGQTMQLSYKVEPADATDVITYTQWDSGNDERITIDENGLVTAKSAGWGVAYLICMVNDEFSIFSEWITVEHDSTQTLKDTKFSQYGSVYHYKELIYGNTCSVCGALGDTVKGEYEEHTWNQGVVTTAPTYTSTGTKTYTCTGCGWTKTETVDKLPPHNPHTWDEGTVTKEATCGRTGSTTYTCTECKETKSESIPKLTTHTWDDGMITRAATCSSQGVKRYMCSTCFSIKTETIAKLTTHTWDDGVITKEATYEAQGVKTFTCTECGTTKSQSIEKLSTHNPHTWDDGVVTKEATCKDEGTKTFICSGCNDTKTEVIERLTTHTWDDGEVTTAATMDAEGVKTYTCTVCGDTKTEVIDKLSLSSPDNQDADQKQDENKPAEDDKKPSNNNGSTIGETTGNGRTLIEAFVARMFTKALGRKYDANGLKYWSDLLESHESDGANVAFGFFNSNEFLEKKVNNDTFVNLLYATFFDRNADSAGYNYWIDQLNQGADRNVILGGFISSKEFEKLCTDAGINRGTVLEDGTVVNAGIYNFVERQYTCCLGRPGEKGGIDWWVDQIATKQQTPVDAAKNFFGSTEFVNKKLGNEDYIKTLYRTFMGREADASGLAYWMSEMDGGQTRDQVLDGFATSNEFKKILTDFGL